MNEPSSDSTRSTDDPLWPVFLLLALAAGLWFVTFAVDWWTFWYKISISAATLAIASTIVQGGIKAKFRLDLKAIAIGAGSALALYGIFYLGKTISALLFDFADGQVGDIYGLGDGSNLWIIAALLFCVTGPSEELFWRGYLQRVLGRRLGGLGGYLLATALYAAVHIWTLNFMLIGASAVAGAFWGLLYWRARNLAPVIISHSLWSAVIFSVAPMH